VGTPGAGEWQAKGAGIGRIGNANKMWCRKRQSGKNRLVEEQVAGASEGGRNR
jgi:hypothetical protein